MTDRNREADAATLRQAAVIFRAYPAELDAIGIDDGGEYNAALLAAFAEEVES